MKRSIIALIESPEVAEKLRSAVAGMEVDVATCSPLHLRQKLLTQEHCNLVIFEYNRDTKGAQFQVEADIAASGDAAYLVVAAEDLLDQLRLPMQLQSDFVTLGASTQEFVLRLQKLLWPGAEASSTEIIVSGPLTINLATYQVKVGEEPIDLTYLEYALLSFLVTHQGRAYSREVLLQRIWGYEYFGGTRTVDVHVRRVRAKLGLELAQRLETIRGVGYMWSN